MMKIILLLSLFPLLNGGYITCCNQSTENKGWITEDRVTSQCFHSCGDLSTYDRDPYKNWEHTMATCKSFADCVRPFWDPEDCATHVSKTMENGHLIDGGNVDDHGQRFKYANLFSRVIRCDITDSKIENAKKEYWDKLCAPSHWCKWKRQVLCEKFNIDYYPCSCSQYHKGYYGPQCLNFTIGMLACVPMRQAFLRPLNRGCVEEVDCNYGLMCEDGICTYCEDCVKSQGIDREDPDWDNKCFYGEYNCPSDCISYFGPCEDNPLPCCRGFTCKKTPEHTSMKRCHQCTLSGESCDEDSDCCASANTDDVCFSGSCISLSGKKCDNDEDCRSNPYKLGEKLVCYRGRCDYNRICHAHGKGCSNTWQDCCNGNYCDASGHCSTCTKEGKSCSYAHLRTCCREEQLVCNIQSRKCVKCTAVGKSCSVQEHTCCPGYKCSSDTNLCDEECMHQFKFCNTTQDCCYGLTCNDGICLQCKGFGALCSTDHANCCPGFVCDKGRHCSLVM